MRLRLLAAAVVTLAFALGGRQLWFRHRPSPANVPTPPAIDSAPVTIEFPDTLRRGETLAHLFARHGLGAAEVKELAALLDLRKLRAGLVFQVRRSHADSVPDQVTVRTGPGQRLTLTRQSSAWRATADSIQWSVDTVRYAGSIETSLYEALDRAVPRASLASDARTQLAWELADVFAWQLDFSRDLQPGDAFQVVLERLTSEEGETRVGSVLAADLEVNGKPVSAFRFTEDGKPGYFDAAGLSLRRAFLRAPVEFRRISSRFNRARRHPVLGYARRHEGTDYAAASGTPVMSAGDGTVVSAGWSGGYGKMVVVRHNNGITTRYGHLRGFAAGVRGGARVSQGQVIGYVGSTGLATGAHLHYEFRVNGVARDPSRVDLGNGAPIAPSLMPAFDADRLLLAHMLLGQPVTAVAAAAVQAASSPVPE
jgi:murein DD-endopeptidase MepM/ murein hydrolase activator NlpD